MICMDVDSLKAANPGALGHLEQAVRVPSLKPAFPAAGHSAVPDTAPTLLSSGARGSRGGYKYTEATHMVLSMLCV